MCAIIGSYDLEKLKELIKLNEVRGNFSWSLTIINPETYNIIKQFKDFGSFPFDKLEKEYEDGFYYICHVQAPTGGLLKEYKRIHPVNIDKYYLWHNGVIKDKWIYDKYELYKDEVDDNFDTKLMLYQIIKSKLNFKESLKDIDGSFACLLLVEGEGLYAFRNTASPLFVQILTLDVSSLKFSETSISVSPHHIYRLDLKYQIFEYVEEFDNINKPFFFAV